MATVTNKKGKSLNCPKGSGIPGENHWPAASHWETSSHNVAWSTPYFFKPEIAKIEKA
jgi:hypothetical protein